MNDDTPATKRDIADLENAITGFAGQVMEKLGQMDDTLENHTHRLDQIDHTLNDHTHRLEQIERKVDATIESVDRLGHRVGRLEDHTGLRQAA
jgi:tetrahydromethanopterin S-methyltransferase subunit G